jgi:phage gp45-like
MSGSPERVIKYAALATVLDQLTGAAATATTQATAAATSNTNSSHWAEGSDAQVIALGGEKSSKGWNTKTNQDGSHWAEGTDQQVIALGGTKSSKGWADVSETQADRSESAARSRGR